jgi:TDG/mug DNA glycosylase family protein
MQSLYWRRPAQEKSRIQAENANTDNGDATAASAGFAPIAQQDARVLILGSLPGQRSLHESEYYAHPRNAFWRIMKELFSIDGDYATRCADLMANQIALWDVLARSIRPGSMDADIQVESSKANDFKGFLTAHDAINLVCFNGRKAGQLFDRLIDEKQLAPGLRFEVLPSTSPAYAAMSFDKKLSVWREIIC